MSEVIIRFSNYVLLGRIRDWVVQANSELHADAEEAAAVGLVLTPREVIMTRAMLVHALKEARDGQPSKVRSIAAGWKISKGGSSKYQRASVIWNTLVEEDGHAELVHPRTGGADRVTGDLAAQPDRDHSTGVGLV
jgi:hypothetical protein